MNEVERRGIEKAIFAADNALHHLESARKYLGSAGNWGLVYILGGGMITGLVKHSKMGSADYFRDLPTGFYRLFVEK